MATNLKAKKSNLLILISILNLFIFFATFGYYLKSRNSSIVKEDGKTVIQGNKRIISVDTPVESIPNKAITTLNMKWLQNLAYGKKEILKKAEVKTSLEGKITLITFKPGIINIDKQNNINYPYKAALRIESTDGIVNTVYFSDARVKKAQIFKNIKGVNWTLKWQDLKNNDKIKIEEQVDLLIPNADDNNNFTDKFVKSLSIEVIE